MSDQFRLVLCMLAFITAVCLVLFLIGCEQKTAFDELQEPCEPWYQDDDEAYWKEYWENRPVPQVLETPEP